MAADGDRRTARRRAALLAGAAALALSVNMASAQEHEAAGDSGETQAFETGAGTHLDQITVVSRTGETAIDTLGSVSNIDQEQIERRMATSTKDIFFGVPGVAIQTDDKRNATNVNIRGLQDFGRVAVIVDGARQDFQRSGHGTESSVFIDPELVQDVSVIRGPVANTYGSGAIGGVVFFETKDADDFLRPDETWALSATERYESNGNGWTASATGAYRFTESFDVLGNIVWRDYGDYKGGGDAGEIPGTAFDVLSGMAKATIRPTENSELKLGWVGNHNSWTEGPDLYDYDVKQNTLTGRYNITDDDRSWLDLHVNLSYNKAGLVQTYLEDVSQFDRDTGERVTVPSGGRTTYDIETGGIDIWNTSRFETGVVSHELTYGGDWLSDDVVTLSAAGGADVYTPSGKRKVGGAYVQDKLTWEWLEVIGALRYDTYSLEGDGVESSGDRVSPRITLGVSPFQDGAPGLKFYGTYAEGYRSPSVTETLISGLHPSDVTFPFLPNPALEPETAKTWEFGVNYGADDLIEAGDALRLKAAYFNNDVSNYIGGTVLDTDDEGCPYLADLTPIWMGGSYTPSCYQYQNYANAKIRGFELDAAYNASWGFLGLTASVINGHTISHEGEEGDLLSIPSSQVTARLGLRFLEERLLIGGEVQYNGAPRGNPTAEDYTLVNAFAQYNFNENLKLDMRVDNIFDVKYVNPLNASTTEPLYEPGVSFKIALTQRFGS